VYRIKELKKRPRSKGLKSHRKRENVGLAFEVEKAFLSKVINKPIFANRLCSVLITLDYYCMSFYTI
jgi:hypothetical protein